MLLGINSQKFILQGSVLQSSGTLENNENVANGQYNIFSLLFLRRLYLLVKCMKECYLSNSLRFLRVTFQTKPMVYLSSKLYVKSQWGKYTTGLLKHIWALASYAFIISWNATSTFILNIVYIICIVYILIQFLLYIYIPLQQGVK